MIFGGGWQWSEGRINILAVKTVELTNGRNPSSQKNRKGQRERRGKWWQHRDAVLSLMSMRQSNSGTHLKDACSVLPLRSQPTTAPS